VIDNGGFTYFAGGPHKLVAAAGAFDSLALPDLAQACREVIQLFPDRVEPHEREQRLQLVKRYADDGRLGPIEDLFWDVPMSRVQRAALAYVRTHGAEFGARIS
jgi:hypothetical protein